MKISLEQVAGRVSEKSPVLGIPVVAGCGYQSRGPALGYLALLTACDR
jgi:hypothetical protein